MRPLSGYVVIDLTRLLPGPLCTYILASLGARVIKIEDPRGGDYSRHVPPLKKEMSPLFLNLNRGKESIAVDLKSAEGKDIVMRLVKRAHIFVESFRPKTAARLGIDYDAIARINPGMVYCSISGYGQKGGYALKPGHDANYMALSGVLDTIRARDGKPVIPGVQIADYVSALFAVIAILGAVMEAQRTARGRYIDIPMVHSAVALFFPESARFFERGSPPKPSGERLSGGFVCYNIYRTKDDRFVALAALEPQFWEAFCRAVNRPDLVEAAYDPATPDSRAYSEVVELFAGRTLAEWRELLADVDTCVEPVIDLFEALSGPPLADLDVVETCEHPGEGSFRAIRLPGLDGSPELPAPELGQHTESVLRELGYSDDFIAELGKKGVIRAGDD